MSEDTEDLTDDDVDFLSAYVGEQGSRPRRQPVVSDDDEEYPNIQIDELLVRRVRFIVGTTDADMREVTQYRDHETDKLLWTEDPIGLMRMEG